MKKMGVRENKMREKKMRENKTHAKISWTKVLETDFRFEFLVRKYACAENFKYIRQRERPFLDLLSVLRRCPLYRDSTVFSSW